jgi:hypothetical protein
MPGFNMHPRRLSEHHLRVAYELGGDHAEDGLRRQLDADTLWDLLVGEPRADFAEDASSVLLQSYEAGYIHLL